MKLVITANGQKVVGVYNDRLLSLFNRLSPNHPNIQRASFVEWDRDDKKWKAVDSHTGALMVEDTTRSGALKKEQKIIEDNLIAYV